jgi:YidC/Oxa1 family membrane protein insertase
MMDKRTIAVMLACMLALMGLNFVVNKIYPPIPKRTPPPAAALTNAVSNAVAQAVAATPTNVPPVPPPVAPAVRPAEQTLAISNGFIRVEFTSWGGGIRRVELLKHNANGHGHIALNQDAPAPALALTGVPGADTNAVFTLESSGPDRVVMRAGSVTKTVSLGKDYLINAEIECGAVPSAGVVAGTARATHLKEAPLYLIADWQDGPKWNDRNLPGGMFAPSLEKRVQRGINREAIRARWVAVKSQYFAMVLTGGSNATAVTYAPVTLPPTPDWTAKEPPQGVMAMGEWPVVNGKLSFSWYAGPKEYERLSALGQGPGEVMDFGSWMDGYTGIFGLALFKGMVWCHKLARNYGVAIILVTILLKIIFWPIQAKSINAMKDMQKFQPQMQKVREKYKDDQQRMNQEIMKLYKEHKINPFSGCLPMLVQLPVLIAFYKVLSNAIELRGASFLWIKDLALPDTIATVMGIPINPLPLVMTGCTVWQQKMTPSTGDAQQQKMMMFMPLIMLFFFYPSASGLVLYWTVQQILSMAQQWWSMRQPAPAQQGPAHG